MLLRKRIKYSTLDTECEIAADKPDKLPRNSIFPSIDKASCLTKGKTNDGEAENVLSLDVFIVKPVRIFEILRDTLQSPGNHQHITFPYNRESYFSGSFQILL